MSDTQLCNCCSESLGMYSWKCDVCRGRLCDRCEEEQDASNHSIYEDEDGDAVNPECPFCSFKKPIVRSPQDAELAALVEYACSKLGTTYEDLYAECFGDRGFEDAVTADTIAAADEA